MGNDYDGLRSWLAKVEKLGELVRVDGASAEQEIGEATDVLQHTLGAPAALFGQVPGYDPSFRVMSNALGTTDRIALALDQPAGLSRLELSEAWATAMRELEPLAARVVTDGPVMANRITGDDIDITAFPAPKWHQRDGGRYIGTGSFDITRDPDEKWVNLGTYRVMVHDRNRLGYYISPGKHGRLQRQKYFDRGEPCPVAMVFGADPLLFLASQAEVPYGVCEYDWVGGLRGEAIDVIEGPVTGLPIPAHAELVVEGFASDTERMLEGPFGEWTGYYASSTRDEPVLTIEAIYHRDDPIIFGAPPGQPPDEFARYRAITRSGMLKDALSRAALPGVRAVWQHECGGGRLLTVVSLLQQYPGHATQALHLAAQLHTAAYTGRYVVVVDEDIDPSNLEEVMWAVCTRSDPATSIDIIHRAWSTPLDPRIAPEDRAKGNFTNSRALIDATRPWEWRNEFPPVNVPDRASRDEANRRWAHLLRK